ncbi:hypothetical protein SAMN05216388_102646 [Halorientalis persicus]|uniref:DUF6884 domain-containing protein n=1 Tax=Halorientalis persicus TaxID=1367881 RepID=A0A1H8U9W6_9EURY|nr:DUF6884 domain-containing protein [Halorientalis persicus]SEP00062.1 hypothetical protein SAMN05216388_102646 [Halorientalis persicus]
MANALHTTRGTTDIALIACGSSKQDLDDGETVPAKDLYNSSYASLKQEFSEELCDDQLILSGEHGVVEPNEPLTTYDASLRPQDDSYIGDEAVAEWADQVCVELATQLHEREPVGTIVVLATSHYLPEQVRSVLSEYRTVYPFEEHDFDGIGDQMGWLRKTIDANESLPPFHTTTR